MKIKKEMETIVRNASRQHISLIKELANLANNNPTDCSDLSMSTLMCRLGIIRASRKGFSLRNDFPKDKLIDFIKIAKNNDYHVTITRDRHGSKIKFSRKEVSQ